MAAVSGSQTAASLELATAGAPVMAIGGFDNEGGNLTVAQFKQFVARGEIHYYIADSNGSGAGRPVGGSGFPPATGGSAPVAGGGSPSTGGPGPSSRGQRPPGGLRGQAGSTSAITAWVKAHYTSETIGGQTLYDLTAPASG